MSEIRWKLETRPCICFRSDNNNAVGRVTFYCSDFNELKKQQINAYYRSLMIFRPILTNESLTHDAFMVLPLFNIANNQEAIKSRWFFFYIAHFWLLSPCLYHIVLCHDAWFISLSVVAFFTVIFFLFLNLTNFYELIFAFDCWENMSCFTSSHITHAQSIGIGSKN